jgi:hypothetical protein
MGYSRRAYILSMGFWPGVMCESTLESRCVAIVVGMKENYLDENVVADEKERLEEFI